jgi:hypothetical protein
VEIGRVRGSRQTGKTWVDLNHGAAEWSVIMKRGEVGPRSQPMNGSMREGQNAARVERGWRSKGPHGERKAIWEGNSRRLRWSTSSARGAKRACRKDVGGDNGHSGEGSAEREVRWRRCADTSTPVALSVASRGRGRGGAGQSSVGTEATIEGFTKPLSKLARRDTQRGTAGNGSTVNI